ncbi:Pre-rRNA-processing protein TSR1 like protein [Dictyocoela muelleri]|nr:Pre-rRNA-processing protein TSR1 like protein [Dictyocoela muelleri]
MKIADRRNKNKQKLQNIKKSTLPQIITIINYNNEPIPAKYTECYQIFTYNHPVLDLFYLSKVSDYIVIMYNDKIKNINHNNYNLNTEFGNTINFNFENYNNHKDKKIIKNKLIDDKNFNIDNFNNDKVSIGNLINDDENNISLKILNIFNLNSNIIFCFKEDEEKLKLKNFILDNNFPDRIVKYDNLFHYLKSLKQRKNLKRPYLVTKNVKFIDDYLFVEGYLHNELVYHKMVCNGRYEFIIEEVLVDDQVYKIKDFSKEIKYETAEIQPEDFQKVQMNDDLEFESNDDESDDCDDESYDDYREGASDINDCKNDYFFADYKDKNSKKYRNIDKKLNKNNQNEDSANSKFDLISQFQSYDDQPKVNPDLLFLRDIKQTENKLLKLKGICDKKVILKLRKNFKEEFNASIFIFFGMYFLEDQKSLVSIFFDSKVPLKSDNHYLIDLGFRLFKVRPTICDGKKMLIRKDKLNVGLMVFVAPITFFRSRCVLFSLSKDSGKSNECIISDQQFINKTGNQDKNDHNSIINLNSSTNDDNFNFDNNSSSLEIFRHSMIVSSPTFENRFVYEEKIFYGYPIKILGNLAKIKGMFGSKEEVDYFKNRMIESRGIKGSIRKSVGKKGNFKAYFEKQIKHGDPVTLKIYRGIDF